MQQAEVMDLTVACQSFPEPSNPEIPRSTFLDTIDMFFESGNRLVVVEGDEGWGKTTLLAQFARRHPNNSISLFVKPASRWGYDPDFLRRDLCGQLEWALHARPLEPAADPNEASLRSGIYSLQKQARWNRTCYYFVVDGLDDVPRDEERIRELLLGMLPFGLPGMRFLLSGSIERLPPSFVKRTASKPFHMSPFTLDDAIKYLDGLATRSDVEDLYRSCKGVPGWLASIRRVLQSGTEPGVLIRELPTRLPELFEIEWRSADTTKEPKCETFLGILAHDRNRHSVSDLGRILGIDPAEVKELSKPLGFVRLDPATSELSFVSEAFRDFAARQLRHLKEKVRSLLIDDLLRLPTSDESLRRLPGYLEEAGRGEEILAIVTPERVALTLDRTRSVSLARQQVRLGVGAALSLHRMET